MSTPSTRTFHRYVFHYEVLSEEPLGSVSLSDIDQLCDSGPCAGRFLDTTHKELTAKQAVNALYKTGSEPGFFQLNDKGEDNES